jgi:hypothetical protein
MVIDSDRRILATCDNTETAAELVNLVNDLADQNAVRALRLGLLEESAKRWSPQLPRDDVSYAVLYLHRRGIEMTLEQLLAAEELRQDIIVRKLADAGKPTLASDCEFFQRLREGTLPL